MSSYLTGQDYIQQLLSGIEALHKRLITHRGALPRTLSSMLTHRRDLPRSRLADS